MSNSFIATTKKDLNVGYKRFRNSQDRAKDNGKDTGIGGARVERGPEPVAVASNKNTVPGAKSAMKPSGLHVSSPALTTRGYQPGDFARVAEFGDRAVNVALTLDKAAREDAEAKGRKNPGRVNAWLDFLGRSEEQRDIVRLRGEVEQWVGTLS